VASWPFIFILVNWANVPELGSVGFVDWLGTALSPENAKVGDDFRHASRYIFLVAGVASLLLAVFSLTLPHTPPKPAGAGKEKFAWLEASKLLRHPFVLVLFVVTFLDAAVHQTFFVWTERYLTGEVGIPSNWATPVMKIGQVAEIGTMIFLGYVLKRLGWRTTMVLGILGHAARFAVFAFVPYAVPAVLINLLHGICYAFFFATVYIFVDEFFPKDVRSSAQGLFNVLILGVGPFVANFVCTRLGDMYRVGNSFDFQRIFLYPLTTAIAAALLLLLFFHPPARRVAEEGAEAVPMTEP
jgi:predicted MFS family arabinose efflux permease